MKISLPFNIAYAKLILSYGEDNFKEIFQDKGKHLYITSFSYNLPEFDNERFLRHLEFVKDIIIVFNIPVWEANDISKVNKLIFGALEKNPYIQFYFCKNNHSKIISNGEKMYIGSASATDILQESLEAGVIFEDKDSIKEIEDQIFHRPYLKYEPIFTDPISPLMIPLLLIIDEMELGHAYISFLNDISKDSDSVKGEYFDYTDHLENSLKNYLKIFQTAKEELTAYGKKETEFSVIKRVLNSIEDSLQSLISTASDYKVNLINENDQERSIYLTNVKAVVEMFLDLRVKWISAFPQSNFIRYPLGAHSIIIWSEDPSLSNRYWRFFLNNNNVLNNN